MTRTPWLFSAPVDLGVFVGSAAVSLALLALAPVLAPAGDTPEWTWITAVLLVDVAHVWSTAWVVYLDPVERARRPRLYTAVPIAAWLAGVALYSRGDAIFWRTLAYLAAFHFIRQQVGWVSLYRARAGGGSAGAWLDRATIYAATLYPLLVWHSEPRAFAWFRPGDFVSGVPPALITAAGLAYATLGVAYLARAAAEASRGFVPWGKHAVIATTAACWYLGIVATDSDYGFTVTNVLIHGVPYLALVYIYVRTTAPGRAGRRLGVLPFLAGRRLGVLPFLATVWALAYAEELLWDRAVWHERPGLFGAAWPSLEGYRHLLVPLLAVPQITHYLLDGVLWRRRSNPRVADVFR